MPTGWVRFDVIARDAATAAHVAMWLRERLPMATIRSEPDPERSDDPVRPHVLRCRAWCDEQSGAPTAHGIASALRELDDVNGENPYARVFILQHDASATQVA